LYPPALGMQGSVKVDSLVLVSMRLLWQRRSTHTYGAMATSAILENNPVSGLIKCQLGSTECTIMRMHTWGRTELGSKPIPS
jgi:hypothetical protein